MKAPLLAVALCLAGTLCHGSEPGTYDARYQAKALGMTAKATRQQSLTSDQHFLLENKLSLTILGANVGTVVESSEFRWVADTLEALHYRYSQTGIRSTQESIDFDWGSGQANSSSDKGAWEVALSPGLLDKLSYNVRLGLDLQDSSEQTEFRYNILDKDEIKEQVYRVSAREVLNTPLGRLNTVKIERVRDDNSQRSTTVWLALDWDYLLVRLEQVSSSGTITELMLESAIVNDQAVTGL